MKYNRVYNFGAGPASLPIEVLEEIQSELLNYQGTGLSVMEMSHRSKEYQTIFDETEKALREIMNIPDNYKVLFLQGGATSEFSAIPLNLMNTGKADYIVSGNFAKKAAEEAKKYGEVRVIGDSKDENYSYIPKNVRANDDSDYLYICLNNTIYGTQFNELPVANNLVGDASSCILGRKIDVNKFDLLYAGAQKNIGIAGLTVVIIKEDLLGKAKTFTPAMFDFAIQSKNGSMYNTPPCFAIYVAGKVFKWVKKQGGVEKIEEVNRQKAKLLYNYLDGSKLFKPTAKKSDRSIMNVTFVTGNEELDKRFVAYCKENNIIGVKGHRLVGGMRASLYNAIDVENVKYLIEVMKRFEDNYES